MSFVYLVKVIFVKKCLHVLIFDVLLLYFSTKFRQHLYPFIQKFYDNDPLGPVIMKVKIKRYICYSKVVKSVK